MVFYIGKGLQVAGLLGVAAALFIGVTGDEAGETMMRELGYAALGALLFYAGRLIESR